MTDQEKNLRDYPLLQVQYLSEAEKLFGPKIDYIYTGLYYRNGRPRTRLCPASLEVGIRGFRIELNSVPASHDRKDGIFQLSHEVVHLLAPVDVEEGRDEVNYLEEGMATYFSKIIVERDTEDYEFFNKAIKDEINYSQAYQLYLSLIEIDQDAVKKLRAITPIIAHIVEEDFSTAELNVDKKLIDCLLEKFP